MWLTKLCVRGTPDTVPSLSFLLSRPPVSSYRLHYIQDSVNLLFKLDLLSLLPSLTHTRARAYIHSLRAARDSLIYSLANLAKRKIMTWDLARTQTDTVRHTTPIIYQQQSDLCARPALVSLCWVSPPTGHSGHHTPDSHYYEWNHETHFDVAVSLFICFWKHVQFDVFVNSPFTEENHLALFYVFLYVS